MALEAALVGARRFRFLAQSTLLCTGLASAGLLVASRQPGFSVLVVWRSVCGLFVLRSVAAGAELGCVLGFYGQGRASA